jgi:hypothetical protein
VPYQIPIWKSLAENAEIPFEVWYLTHHGVYPSFDSGFGETFLELYKKSYSRVVVKKQVERYDIDKCVKTTVTLYGG